MSQYLKTLQMQTHKQTVGRVPGILLNSAERSAEVRGVRDTTRKLPESTNLGSQGLTKTGPATRGSAWTDLATRHIC